MKRLKLKPSRLVEIRDMLANDLMSAARSRAGLPPYMRVVAESMSLIVKSAPVWWVSRDMGKLVMSVDPDDVPRIDPSTKSGFLVFEDDLPIESSRGVRLRGMIWNVGAEEMYTVAPLTCDKAALKKCGDRLIPIAPMDDDDSAEVLDAALSVAYVVWALSSQPVTCDVVEHRWRRDSGTPAGVKPPKEARTVKMLILREHRDPWQGPGRQGEAHYSHRFIVRGFWRNQPYGPRNSLRRKQWIPPYVKGPADKPLVVKETVRIWRR